MGNVIFFYFINDGKLDQLFIILLRCSGIKKLQLFSLNAPKYIIKEHM